MSSKMDTHIAIFVLFAFSRLTHLRILHNYSESKKQGRRKKNEKKTEGWLYLGEVEV